MSNKILPSNAMPLKVKIPMALFSSIITLLDDIDIDCLCPDTTQLHGYVRFALNQKKNDIQLRNSQTRLLYSQDALFGWDTARDLMYSYDDDQPF